MTKAERQSLSDHTYVHSVFGAMNKNKYPMYTLMNAAKQVGNPQSIKYQRTVLTERQQLFAGSHLHSGR